MIEDAMAGKLNVHEAEQSTVLLKINNTLNARKLHLRTSDRTSALWLQYMDMVDILRRFICAERLGNWHLHLATLQQILPIFAACGHNNYAKSVWLYLMRMQELEEKHPKLYEQYIAGHHVLRRTEKKKWGGLSIDLVVEQTLMRSLKSVGGLTPGKGFDDIQKNIFIFSRPICAEVNEAVEKLTNAVYITMMKLVK